jgi:hypothetical protein
MLGQSGHVLTQQLLVKFELMSVSIVKFDVRQN